MEIKFLNLDIFVPKILGGGGVNYPKDSRGGVINPNNPPYIRHCIYQKLLYSVSYFKDTFI